MARPRAPGRFGGGLAGRPATATPDKGRRGRPRGGSSRPFGPYPGDPDGVDPFIREPNPWQR